MNQTNRDSLGVWRRAVLACVVSLAGATAPALGQAQGLATDAPPAATAPTNGAKPAASAPAVDDVSDQLKDLVDGVNYPGMAAVVVRGRDVIARGVAGVRKIGDPTPMTAFDKFHMGSCTKAMTATLCAMLVEEGKLRWDSTIGEVFPELKPKMTGAWANITLHQLLTHTAGATKDLHKDGLWGELWNTTHTPEEARMDMLRKIISWDTDFPPGTQYQYANTNFIIAGMMAERVEKEPYEELITRKIFRPLGMDSAGFGAPGSADVVDQPWGTTREGKSMAPSRNADNPPMLSPAGRVHVTLDDWAKFVSLHIEGERAATARLLKPESYVMLHTPALNNYACGWGRHEKSWGGPRNFTLSHSGSNTMWYCVAWLAPDKDMAVLVATNTSREGVTKQCDQAAWRLIQKYVQPAPAIAPDK